MQQSFVLGKLRQLASPKFNRVKSSLMAVPGTKTFKVLVGLPFGIYAAGYTSAFIARKFVYDSSESDKSDSEGGKGSNNPGAGKGKSWYQVSKVAGAEGSYNLLGFEFRSPQMVMLTFVRNYMGNVVKEVLADDKVN